MNNNSTNGVLYAGGFAGEILGGGVLESCYALGDVDITASRSMHVGGLVGYTENFGSSAIITQCYASGDVTASGTDSINIGGLVGFADNAVIANCYALGKVDGTTTGSPPPMTKIVNAGGLVGLIGTTTIIEYCFAKGTVSVTAPVGITHSAGGIAGRRTEPATSPPSPNETFINNAALGDSIVNGNGTVEAGRVLGINAGGAVLNAIDNYAWEGMLLVALPNPGVTYNGDNPTHGTRKSEDNFKNPAAIWRNLLGFNQSSLTSVMPWNLTSAAALGYPTLTGLGGQ
jgi:hypothetical protein